VKTKRFVFGLVSSLLFSAGFCSAAERFDPLIGAKDVDEKIGDERSAPDCNPPCLGDPPAYAEYVKIYTN